MTHTPLQYITGDVPDPSDQAIAAELTRCPNLVQLLSIEAISRDNRFARVLLTTMRDNNVT